MGIKKPIQLIAHRIYPEQHNLYDDIYLDKKVVPVDEINRLLEDTQTNFLKMGRMFLCMIDGKYIECFYSIFDYYFKEIKRTQIIKYIEAYNYANLKFQKGQSTDTCIKLGIEKVYLVTRLESQEKREKLEQFALDNNLTVKQLASLVKVLNGTSETLNLAKQFEEQLKEKNENESE